MDCATPYVTLDITGRSSSSAVFTTGGHETANPDQPTGRCGATRSDTRIVARAPAAAVAKLLSVGTSWLEIMSVQQIHALVNDLLIRF